MGKDTVDNVVAARWLPCGDSALYVGEKKLGVMSHGLEVFPNPNSGTFTLSLSNVTEKCNVEIYNMVGEKVFSQLSIVNYPLSIDLTGQPSGIYLYRVLKEDGGVVGSGKVIVE